MPYLQNAFHSLQISASLLAADFARLGEVVQQLTQAGVDRLHIDIMDGHFVPNLTLGPGMVKALRPFSTLPFDIHLMISPVDLFLEPFAQAGADCLTIHPEAGPHVHRSLQAIRKLGKKAGIALNPGTSPVILDTLLEDLDHILVMTVNPGFGGQEFISSQLKKISQVRSKIGDRPIDLSVDGGVTPENAPQIVEAGANILVVGTALFKTDSFKETLTALRLPFCTGKNQKKEPVKSD